MASLRNAMKSRQRLHRERHQPLTRQHLGPLEKKKDYKIRAKDQNDKKAALSILRKKALNKNPDEFHYHMINSKIKNGIHFEKVEDEELSVGDVAKDLTYVTHRRSMEKKQIDKLKAKLHLLEPQQQQPLNTHILFVDSEKEAKTADPAKMLDTHPLLLSRTFNRLRSSQLASLGSELSDPAYFKQMSSGKRKAYKELAQRIQRENKLRIMQDKLEVRKKLMDNKAKNGDQPKLVEPGTSTSAPVYLWPQIRKK